MRALRAFSRLYQKRRSAVAHLRDAPTLRPFLKRSNRVQRMEGTVKYLLLALPLVAAACSSTYGGGYAGNYSYSRYPSYAYGYNATGDAYYGQPYYGGENCGTPYEPKA